MIPAWLLAGLCLAAALILLAYWRRRAPWTPWWIVALPLAYLGGLYGALQFGALADLTARPLPIRAGLLVLALAVLFATLISWRHRSRP